MHSRRLIRLTAMGALLASSLYASIRVGPAALCRITIDASHPQTIKAPFEVTEIGKRGEPGLWIGPNRGRGWKGEAGGEATYRFYVPRDGVYHAWIYSLWHDACTNAIYAQIDKMDKVVLGNDPIYNRWHWVRGTEFSLKKGVHLLRLSNHSDNLAVREIFLTNVTTDRPATDEPMFQDLFYDAFDGCHKGNFGAWEVTAGTWDVLHLKDAADLKDNTILGTSSETAMLMLRTGRWREFNLGVSVRTPRASTKGWVGLCFALRDPRDHYRLQWKPGADDRAAMQLVRQRAGGTDVLASFQAPWVPDQWHIVEIAVESERIGVRIDGGQSMDAPFRGEAGGIGFWLEGQMEALFDNVHVRTPDPMFWEGK